MWMLQTVQLYTNHYLLYSWSSQHLEPDLEETEGPAPMYRLVLAGDAGAGKSSFLLRLTNNQFKGDIQTTLGGWHCSHNRTHTRARAQRT